MKRTEKAAVEPAPVSSPEGVVMEAIEHMFSATPNRGWVDAGSLAACVQACHECAAACTSCADACLGEAAIAELRRCIRLNLDCADVTGTTASVLSRLLDADVETLRAQLEACIRCSSVCASECARHGHRHEHCRVCAAACHNCEAHCRRVLRELPGTA